MLFAARALQGAFAALLAPAALSLITVTFTDAKERARAFGVFGAISGGGAAIGLILGGVLTEYASWRWCLLRQHADRDRDGDRRRRDRAARAGRTATPATTSPASCWPPAGCVALVYGFTEAAKADAGWTAAADPRAAGARGRAAGRVRRGRGPLGREPAAAAADRPGPQPGRLVPRVPAGRRRAVRDVPVPDLLLPDQPGLQPAEDRVRVPAVQRWASSSPPGWCRSSCRASVPSR